MWGDIAAVFGGSAEFKASLAGFFTVARDGDGGKLVAPVWKAESETESSVGPKFYRTVGNGDGRVRFGRAVNDELCIDLEPKLPFPWEFASGGTADIHFKPGGLFGENEADSFFLGGADRCDLFLKLATDQFSNLHRAHPDATKAIDVDQAC